MRHHYCSRILRQTCYHLLKQNQFKNRPDIFNWQVNFKNAHIDWMILLHSKNMGEKYSVLEVSHHKHKQTSNSTLSRTSEEMQTLGKVDLIPHEELSARDI